MRRKCKVAHLRPPIVDDTGNNDGSTFIPSQRSGSIKKPGGFSKIRTHERVKIVYPQCTCQSRRVTGGPQESGNDLIFYRLTITNEGGALRRGPGADVWSFPDEINGICITREANEAQVPALMRQHPSRNLALRSSGRPTSEAVGYGYLGRTAVSGPVSILAWRKQDGIVGEISLKKSASLLLASLFASAVLLRRLRRQGFAVWCRAGSSSEAPLR